MKENPARAREFTRMLFEVHQHLANQIAELLDLNGVQRMMDLGGGSGVVSMALLRKYPALTSTVVDIENVCTVGRQIAAEQDLSGRISYHPADFVSDEFPKGFDLILQCDVGIFGLALFQKLHASLKPSGRLVFVEHLSPDKSSAPVTRLDWTFRDSLRDPNFGFPTLTQVIAQLTQAGFKVSPGHQTLGAGWSILQAYR
jgi:cyclopropane fatty-acyl-phospholipid synthase-like methyltransferase